MPLYVKDPEVDELAERLVSLRKVSKTEVVRQALKHELDRVENKPSLPEWGAAFVRALRAKGDPSIARPADKDFIDSLYE